MERLKSFYLKNNPAKISFRKLSLLLVAIVAFSSLYIWQRVAVVKEAKQIEKLKEVIAEQEKEYKYKSREVSLLNSAARIGKIAKEKLGLEYAKVDQIRFVYEPKDTSSSKNTGDFWVQMKELTQKLPKLRENTLLAKEEKKHGL
jgi:cell division protein FtsL